jgi:hypothetical protein
VLALVAVTAAPAMATTVNPVNSSYDRPGITSLPGGNFDIAWAGTDANGEVNVALLGPGGNVISKFTDTSSSTFPGTGAAIGNAFGDFVLVAWTDLSGTVHVALPLGNGLACESTGFGSSVDTPYLTLAADGTAYLTTVDSSGAMHVTEVDDNGCINEGGFGGSGTLEAGPSTTVSGNTTYVGPTLVDLNGSGTPDLWLIWAGTNSSHSINIAHFTPGDSTLGTKYVESTHSTLTDMGATTGGTNGSAFFTYCGTNNVPYGQSFNGSGPGTQQALGSDKCGIYSNDGYTNGGVDVTYDPSQSNYAYLFPKTNYQLVLDRS